MALTKVTGNVVKTTTDLTINNLTGVAATFTGNVSVGGTLTYEDVTSIEAVGIITAKNNIDARKDVLVGAGVSVVGVTTSTGGFVGALTGTASGNATLSNNADNRVITGGSGNALNGEANLTFDGSTLLQFNGTTDPKIRLQSAESGSKRLDLWIDGGDAIGYIAADQSASSLAFKTTGSERLRITAAGLVGINNTPSTAQFVVKNSDDANRNSIDVYNDNGNLSSSISQDSSGSGSFLQKDNSGTIKTFIKSYGDSYFNGGKVGINEASPDRDLHISNTTPYIRVESTSANQPATLELYHTRGNGSDKWPSSVATDDAALTFNVAAATNGNPVEKLRITSTGLVTNKGTWTNTYAANDTTQCGYQSQNLSDTTNTYAALRLTAGNSSPATAQIASIRTGTGQNDLTFQLETSNTAFEALRITSAGRMGLGTNSPTSILHVSGGSSPTILNKPSDATPAYFVGDSNRTGAGQHLAEFKGRWNGNDVARIVFLAGADTSNKDDGDIRIDTTTSGGSSTERLRITSAGKIEVKGTRSGALQANDDDTLKLFTASTNNSIDRGAGITFYTHDGSGFEMGGTIQVAKENGTADNPASYMRFSTQSGSTTTERLRITSGGDVLIGRTSTNTSHALCVQADGGAEAIVICGRSADDIGELAFFENDSSTRLGEVQYRQDHVNFRHRVGDIRFCTAGATERVRIDSVGRLLVGTDTAMNTGSNDIRDTIQAVAPSGAQLLLGRNDTGTVNTNRLGEIAALCNDQSGGNAYEVGASIRFEADASQGDGDKPTAIVFKTCANGSNTLTERARFTSGGALRIDKTTNETTNTGLVLNPTSQSFMGAEASWVLELNRETNDGHMLRFTQDNSLKGQISVSGNTIAYEEFLGAHRGRFSDGSKPTMLPGTIVETINKSIDHKTATVGVGNTILIPYYGSVGAGGTDTVTYHNDEYTSTIGICAELHTPAGELNKHTCYKISDTVGSKAVGGVFVGWDCNDIPEGMSEPYNDFNVGALGDYFIRMKAGETVAIGDLVESNGDGTGKVQSDDIVRSKTVGKITMTTPQRTYDDNSFLVTAVLYCG